LLNVYRKRWIRMVGDRAINDHMAPALPISPPQLIALQLFSIPFEIVLGHLPDPWTPLGIFSSSGCVTISAAIVSVATWADIGRRSTVVALPPPRTLPSRFYPPLPPFTTIWYSHWVLTLCHLFFAELETASCIEDVQWIRYNNICT